MTLCTDHRFPDPIGRSLFRHWFCVVCGHGFAPHEIHEMYRDGLERATNGEMTPKKQPTGEPA